MLIILLMMMMLINELNHRILICFRLNNSLLNLSKQLIWLNILGEEDMLSTQYDESKLNRISLIIDSFRNYS
jgi:hypothetical protein